MKLPALPPPVLRTLLDCGTAEDELSVDFQRCAVWQDPSFEVLWRRHGRQLLAAWVEEHAGSRPQYWWSLNASEPRLRLGGIGTPCHEALADVAVYSYGIPVRLIDQWQVQYYTGRARDIHGQPIGTAFRSKRFAGAAIDPRDPPTFESQAAFLRRHKLLLPGEARRLTEADFEPEVVLPALDNVAVEGSA